MTPDEKEQFGRALGQTLDFYNKKLEPQHMSFWLSSMKPYRYEEIRTALIAHVSRGKHAPRPADVIELINENRELHTPRLEPSPERECEPAPEHVRKAWTWAIRQWGGAGETLFADPKLTEEEVEEALLLINQQCFASKNPEAYPEHCHLQSIWGCSYADAVSRYGDQA